LLCWNHVAKPIILNTIKPTFENIFALVISAHLSVYVRGKGVGDAGFLLGDEFIEREFYCFFVELLKRSTLGLKDGLK
jgi:hypothetical protein